MKVGCGPQQACLRLRRKHGTEYRLLFIGHKDWLRLNTRNRTESALSDRGPQLADAAEVVIGWAATNQFLMQVLAEHVGGIADQRVVVAGAVHACREDRNHILAPLRKFGHPTLAVGQLELEA